MSPSTAQQPHDGKRPLAVFDYDGTCIDGQSGSLLSVWLLKNRLLSPRTVTGLVSWGFRYKFHLPYRQERARELIFRDLGPWPREEVFALMARFHDEVLVNKYRPQAMEEIARRKEEGCAVVLISATFKAIAQEAAKTLGVDGYVATQMEVDEWGRYTGRVMGDVIAGEYKVKTAARWADEHLGEGAWYLAYAYGDHHSDMELLAAAEHPFAVSPGPTLKKTAERNGWPIVDWKQD